jgi:hypothetical protein
VLIGKPSSNNATARYEPAQEPPPKMTKPEPRSDAVETTEQATTRPELGELDGTM